MDINKGDLRYDVLFTLIDREEIMSPKELGQMLGEPRQKIRYHLNLLENMGLVVNNDGKYCCQPVFIEDQFQEKCFNKIESLVPDLIEKIYIEFEDEEDRETVVLNCLKVELLKIMRDYS